MGTPGVEPGRWKTWGPPDARVLDVGPGDVKTIEGAQELVKEALGGNGGHQNQRCRQDEGNAAPESSCMCHVVSPQ